MYVGGSNLQSHNSVLNNRFIIYNSYKTFQIRSEHEKFSHYLTASSMTVSII